MIRRASNERGNAHVHPRHRVKIHGTKMDQPGLELLVRVGLATLLGIAIGIERQRRSRMAGLQTMALVSMGSGLFTILGAYDYPTQGDRNRVAAQIVTGIGFLGTGVIVKKGLRPFGR